MATGAIPSPTLETASLLSSLLPLQHSATPSFMIAKQGRAKNSEASAEGSLVQASAAEANSKTTSSAIPPISKIFGEVTTRATSNSKRASVGDSGEISTTLSTASSVTNNEFSYRNIRDHPVDVVLERICDEIVKVVP